MNCHDFEKLALGLARNSLLDAAARDQGLIHTEGCARCAARLAEERDLLARLRALAVEMAGDEPPARVDALLLAAFRAHTAATASSTVVPMAGGAERRSSWKLAAAAAGILILTSAMAVLWKSTSSRMPRREERAVAHTPVNTPGPQAEPPVGRDQVADERPKNLPKRVRRRASVKSPDEAEVVTQFFPLREGEDLTILDSLQVVRVELPGSALGEVGLPFDPETGNEPVKADVVLGQDGLARAIRFVR
jgi:anti-sigma factor RsiW